MTDRRGNGLLADAYVPLIVLPPSMADLMLDALRRSGIAAYAIPINQLEADVSAEESPTDHLYVDAQERATAERILREELPDHVRTDAAAELQAGGDRSDDDDVWADLVARFYESEGTQEGAAWPDAENVGRERSPDLDDTDAFNVLGGGGTAENDPPTSDATEGRVVRPAGGNPDGEHYVPPPPPPFPRGDLTSRLAWGGLFGGPLLLLGSMLLSMPLPGWLAFCAVAAFIAGFVVLVVRMGDRPSGGNGPDDGAVV